MNTIKLVKPPITFAEAAPHLQKIFDSGMLTKGNYVSGLQKNLAAYTGAKHAFLTTSATTALSLCLKILQIKPGDEVIVADFSFPATANVVEDIGAIPIFADVQLDTFNMSPEDLKQKITDKTKAVIFVDTFGNPTGIHKIKAICEAHNLPLIEDAACAIGSAESNLRCGNIADLTCFSFHPRKLITSGEGGAITTNNTEWAHQLDIKLNHGADGFKNNALDFVDYGYNYRLSEIQAAMLQIQLDKIDDIIQPRQTIREAYIKALTSLGFEAQLVAEPSTFNCQSLVFKVPELIERNALIQHLRDNNIESTIGTYCLSGTTYFEKKYGRRTKNTSGLEKTTITLPCYEGVEIQEITSTILNYCETCITY